jgi:hypothetical protein
MHPSEFRNLVMDPAHEGTDYIMEHPDMVKMTSNMTELPGGLVVQFG